MFGFILSMGLKEFLALDYGVLFKSFVLLFLCIAETYNLGFIRFTIVDY